MLVCVAQKINPTGFCSQDPNFRGNVYIQGFKKAKLHFDLTTPRSGAHEETPAGIYLACLWPSKIVDLVVYRFRTQDLRADRCSEMLWPSAARPVGVLVKAVEFSGLYCCFPLSPVH